MQDIDHGSHMYPTMTSRHCLLVAYVTRGFIMFMKDVEAAGEVGENASSVVCTVTPSVTVMHGRGIGRCKIRSGVLHGVLMEVPGTEGTHLSRVDYLMDSELHH